MKVPPYSGGFGYQSHRASESVDPSPFIGNETSKMSATPNDMSTEHKNRPALPATPALRAVKQVVGALQWISPNLAARVALLACSIPRSSGRALAADAIFAKSRKFKIEVEGTPVQCYRWGDKPTVLLVHGWSASAKDMAAFVEPLIGSGLGVVAFDAVGHGLSKGWTSDLLSFSRAIEQLRKEIGDFVGIVAHSIGAAAAVHSLSSCRDFQPRLALVSPNCDPQSSVASLSDALGLGQDAARIMTARLEQRFGCTMEELSITRTAKSREAPVLVVHDHDDRVVSKEEGMRVVAALPDARYLETHRLGHRRILADPQVVDDVVKFLTVGHGPSLAACRL